ncbi:hypothetical protein [Micromonospora sp. WMMD1082]|uniref:hypothetical protein n=1 Tax=Micromonospora sp. WMMD1082 TaxID=3016104 RepID=UPI002417D50D|nr:hypothetical protein [Micromonospora sp. WMMD1082]MDG4798717.1 hypothetical protein [Micromonospora sp. WMMD1082]
MIYLSEEARQRLAAAQQVVDAHVVDCDRCRTDRPCYARIEAERVFLRYGRLPRRTPGLTGAGVAGHRSFAWLCG